MSDIVVDTSVIIKWFAPEEESEKAKKILDLVAEDRVRLVLPHFAQLEIVNILRLGKKTSLAKIDSYINAFFDLMPQFVPLDRQYCSEIASLMVNFNLAAYDAAFIAVANRWKIPFYTADYKHHLKSISDQIVWLSDWSGKI